MIERISEAQIEFGHQSKIQIFLDKLIGIISDFIDDDKRIEDRLESYLNRFEVEKESWLELIKKSENGEGPKLTSAEINLSS